MQEKPLSRLDRPANCTDLGVAADAEQYDFVVPLDRVADIPEGRNGKKEKRYPSAENGMPLSQSKGWFSWLRR